MDCRRVLVAALAAYLLQAPHTPVSARESLDSRLAAVEKAVDSRRQDLNIAGASLVIVKDDKVILLKGFGERDVERHLPVTPDTLFAIGSSSKAFTAMTVLMCVDEGKLSLQDSPRIYLPYFKLRDPEADSKITIADLLSHRSGLSRTDLAWYTGSLNSQQIIRTAGMAKPTARLGERFQYQNVMFLAAGEIVAKVQGTSWQEFVERRIFRPLGMSASNLSVRKMLQGADFALGYAYDASQKKQIHLPMRNLEAIAPAGAINSSARDMAQWVRLMLNGGSFQGKRLLSENSFAELTKKRITMGGPAGYGFGWMLRDWKGHAVVEHGGNIDGFNAQVALMPDQKLGLALLTNVSASPLGGFAMQKVWEELVGPKDSAPPAVAAGGAAAPPEKEAGTYMIAAANVKMVVALRDGRLVLTVPGQPAYPMENVGGRRYRLASPAPDGFFATFRPKADNPARSEMYLEQPHGNVAADREEAQPFDAGITVEELQRKAIEALGGEANLRRHRSLHLAYDSVYDEQGVTGKGRILLMAPNRLVQTETLYAVGRSIATTRDYCDGQNSGVELSFSASTTRAGASLVDALAAADFYEPLNWRSLYKTLTIVGVGRVGGEEAYIVEKQPEKGSPIKDYISKSSFLLVRREGPGPVSETWSDYRAVDGVKVPFKLVRSSPLTGEGTLTFTEARFDVKVAESAFAPKAVAGRSEAARHISRPDPFG